MTQGGAGWSGRLGYGCWRWRDLDLIRARGLVERAVEAGMTLVDTADVYGLPGGSGHAEELLGAVLAEAPDLRARLAVVTKGGIRPGVPYDSGRRQLVTACEASLRRLRTETIDLYLVHRPDLLAHPQEVAGALSELRAAGKVREVGISNYSAGQARALLAHLDCPLAAVQIEFSVLHLDPLDDGVLDLCLERGITPMAWSPLAGGKLVDGGRGELTRQLDLLSEAHATNPAAIALAFLMAHPAGVVPLVGTTDVRRLGACAEALGVRLGKADWYALLAATGRALP